ncbi:hypothetical protein [Actinomadura sp. CNU-125]|uniref:hypothetical protein n=1 Tax=Actinomadura sp. CNU-125 TaxID=1904961 RepID=UPI0021CCA1CF|nr:hypothetical protein [Actinomadura sp. CNU-125]
MPGFVLRRLTFAALVMWLVSTLVFAFLHLSPVSVERVVAGPRATPDASNGSARTSAWTVPSRCSTRRSSGGCCAATSATPTSAARPSRG